MTNIKNIQSVLIANRGEIACRIIKTARQLGIRTIAIYSDTDEKSKHVRMADAAAYVGASPAQDSYLNISAILTAAKSHAADAIHPGYGFLSENAAFATAVNDAGIIFIGPTTDAIHVMGDKAVAKRRMIDAGVPCIPGYQGEDQSDEAFNSVAEEIGFPMMVKAAAGGGGRGMRLVHDHASLSDAIRLARSEAENAFGSGDLILERAVSCPRHVEIQVLADAHGNTLSLGERDCSVQRRHQKILEESPCPIMTLALRDAMGDAAVKAAKDIGYIGAGTVEFLLDEDNSFYFLEMNTRLQVEHPVTEMVTDLDLVALQFEIASGAPLQLSQDDIKINGHAIEARIYAEDPENDFLPATGSVDLWRAPDGVRVDAGIETGDGISPFYDPMVAKVIAHGETRDVARRKLVTALRETALIGATSNIDFLIHTLENDAFIKGEATTAFISKYFPSKDYFSNPPQDKDYALAASVLFLSSLQKSERTQANPIEALMGWASASPLETPYQFLNADDTVFVRLVNRNELSVSVGDRNFPITVKQYNDTFAELFIDGEKARVYFVIRGNNGSEITFSSAGRTVSLININTQLSSANETAVVGAVISPMHGVVARVDVTIGDKVAKGQTIAIVEAMKMQHEMTAPIDGEVTAVSCSPNDQVAADQTLILIE